jgi:F-type H+-transporting ATPase subunit delta
MSFSISSTLAKKISRRYSQALFGLALEKKALEPIHADVVFLTETIRSSEELRNFIYDPQHPAALCQSVLKELFQDKLQETTFAFLLFIIEKGRFNIIEDILKAFTRLYHDEYKIRTIEIISATELLPQQIDAICKKLKLRWNHEYFAETSVNADLIGGFQIKSGDQVLDFSMKNQLDNFRRQIINA